MAEKKKKAQKQETHDVPATQAAAPAQPSKEQTFTTHGRTFTGVVTSDKMTRTVVVTWERRYYLPKYQRYERRYTKVAAHNPDAIDAKKGDTVTIMETRPISKTKHFIVIKKH